MDLNGVVVAFAGIVTAFLGFTLLSSLYYGACWFLTFSTGNCTDPRQVLGVAFYLAVAGSGLVSIGVWKAASARFKITFEGSGLVTVTGSTILAAGFLTFAIPPVPSYFSGAIAYFSGLFGLGLVMGGIVKMSLGERGLLQTQQLAGPTEVLQRVPKALPLSLL